MIRGRYVTIAELRSLSGDGERVRVRGWVRTSRRSGRVGFITLNDGSCFSGCQIVYDAEDGGVTRETAAKLRTGCAVEASGELVMTPLAKQPFEIRADEVSLVGSCDDDYPMQKKRHTLEFLRESPHLRVRTNTFLAMFRVRSALSAAIHGFFRQNGFIYVTTPIITGSDAEGAGEVFGVSGGHGDFFGKDAFLTVSGQLHAEPFALAFDKVYTFGPTFRAENSNTAVHASEFWMIEPEMAFCDLEDDMEVMESLVKHCIRAVLESAREEMDFFSAFYDSENALVSRLTSVADSVFKRLTYTESIELLKKSGREFRFPVEWGADLKTEHERYLCETAGGPVFITDYPKEIKAFYMRLNDDGKTVAACDLLVPGVGELIGGSQREERPDALIRRLDEMRIPRETLRWYTDLRRFGTAPHSGFGVGLERFLLYLTGIGNIRDVIPYPRTPGTLIF
ncbi:MAG: asparagine--tRNA ligase [Oscillospiraceae bacterium]|jgi:asparaginyl-tRNA synthetase|nr:asparagine--tRNA ligase [Oscillospiraceae bacterium]